MTSRPHTKVCQGFALERVLLNISFVGFRIGGFVVLTSFRLVWHHVGVLSVNNLDSSSRCQILVFLSMIPSISWSCGDFRHHQGISKCRMRNSKAQALCLDLEASLVQGLIPQAFQAEWPKTLCSRRCIDNLGLLGTKHSQNAPWSPGSGSLLRSSKTQVLNQPPLTSSQTPES